jgi:ribonucleoside-triphosphate reductase
MSVIVHKRDGKTVPFNKEKIIRAINSALIAVDGRLYEEDTAKDIAEDIEKKVSSYSDVWIDELQDQVETFLMRSERPDVAREYIRYRYKKEVARSYKHDFIDAIREKLNADDVQRQNANVDEQSFGGRIGEASGVVTKKLALDYIISGMARKNHENNEIYIHDLDNYYVGSHNCLSIPFDDLLAKGFNTRQTDVRPAGSVNTAF